MKTVFRITFLFLLLLGPVSVVHAQDVAVTEPDPTSLVEVLKWIVAGPGALFVVGAVLALVAENVPAWHKVSPNLKFVLSLVVAGILPVLAKTLLEQTEIIELVSPYFALVMTGAMAWLGSQLAYQRSKKLNYGRNGN